MQRIFVTGYLRSGTTLLEKVLHAHPCICLGAQPFPVLYYAAKEAFHRDIGFAPADYPLGPLFQNRAYGPDDFTAFLERWVCSRAELDQVFERLSEYSGWQTPELARVREDLRPGGFGALFAQLVDALPEIYGKTGVTHTGAKEVFCEEFIPYLLGQGVKVALILRDVRDVVASMNFGGEQHVGPVTPTLYALRQWRKSAAFALAHEGDANFAWLRYEDLVDSPREALDTLTRLLGIDPYPQDPFAEGLRDQSGQPWQGNSSFHAYSAIDGGSVGMHRKTLPADCVHYIESLCHPELSVLGYPLAEGAGRLDEAALRSFREPVPPTRPHVPPGYSTDPRELDREIARLEHLQGGLDDPEQIAADFIRPEAFARLRSAQPSTTPAERAPGIGYSVVVPVYNSTQSVVELVDRLDAVFRERLHETHEVILIDDCSPNPETWPTLERLAATHGPVRAVLLMRNFGKAGAVLCGFAEARGRYVVTLDDDLQQLPEDLPLLVAERTHDVVIGCPRSRRDSLGTRFGSRVKGWFDRRLLGKPRNLRIGPYKLFKAEVVKSMLHVRTPYPFIPALMYYVTRDVVNVKIEHAGRAEGRSGFTLAKRVRQFLALLINNSSFLLQVVAILGVLMSLVSVGLGGFVIAKKLLYGVNVAGWTSLAVIVLMSSGLILFSLGVIGEYLIRIINGIEARQPYVVRTRTVGNEETAWDRSSPP